MNKKEQLISGVLYFLHRASESLDCASAQAQALGDWQGDRDIQDAKEEVDSIHRAILTKIEGQ